MTLPFLLYLPTMMTPCPPLHLSWSRQFQPVTVWRVNGKLSYVLTCRYALLRVEGGRCKKRNRKLSGIYFPAGNEPTRVTFSSPTDWVFLGKIRDETKLSLILPPSAGVPQLNYFYLNWTNSNFLPLFTTFQTCQNCLRVVKRLQLENVGLNDYPAVSKCSTFAYYNSVGWMMFVSG